MNLIWRGRLIGDDEIKLICQTKEGAQEINALRISARTAFASEHLLGFIAYELKALSRDLSYEERETFCNVLYACLFTLSQEEVDKYVKECFEHLQEHNFQMPVTMGNA